jgi:hypothetical protein
VRVIASLGLVLAACAPGGGDESSTASAGATSTSGDSTEAPTTSGTTAGGTGSTSGDSVTGSTSTTGEPTGSSTQSVDSTTDGTGTTGGTSTSDGTGTSTSTSTSDGTGTSTSDGTSTGGTSTTGVPDCVPTEQVEVSCDGLDNDCDDLIDNIDVGKDGICDCLNIGILGATGFAPNANFEAWLEDQGSDVTRTLLANNPGVITPAFLDKFDLVLLDRIERALSPEEAKAIEAFVKTDGRGMITLIGYNFDNNNPAPERDRANTALAPFGLAYQGGYFGNAVIPTFNQNHPASKGIFDVNFAGGIMPVDNGNQGMSTVIATVAMMNAGLAHQTAMDGGRVIVWGDEWITFDSDWQGFADVQELWVNMVSWAKPQDFCGVPQ